MAIHSRFPEPTAIAKSFRKFRENFWNFREFFELFRFFKIFSLFSKNSGRRDLSAVKVSALYDAWRLKKRRKTATTTKKKLVNFERAFTPRGWLRLAWESGKTRFGWFPVFDFSTPKKIFRPKFFGRKKFWPKKYFGRKFYWEIYSAGKSIMTRR